MPEVLRLLPWFLVPVVTLLFLTLRLSRRLRYPHDLLVAEDRRGLASLLVRNFRTHYDVLLDALIAATLALTFGLPVRRWPAAVVIDGSRAMISGLAEERPLAKAIKRIRVDPGLQKAEPFLLASDPRTGETHLEPLRQLLSGTDREEAVRKLRERYEFLAPDYGRLVELRRRGFGEITLLTDQLRIQPEGFGAIELGFAGDFAAYPAAARFDRPTGAWLVTLVESGPRADLGISIWDERATRFVRLPPDRYRIQEGAAGRTLRLSTPGLYLLSLKGPFGLEDIDLPVHLPAREQAAAAAGAFSSRMLSVFPDVDRTASPQIALVDQGQRGPRGVPATVTTLVKADGEALLDPAACGGALLAVGRGPGLVLGPSSLANEDLVLAYEAVLAPQASTHAPVHGLLPASQFFETRPGPRLHLPPPTSSRWPWALGFAALASLKLFLWSRLSGQRLFLRGSASRDS